MEEKEFYSDEEIQQDLNEIKEGIELLEDYNELIKKVEDLKK